jgi:peptide/nickel transport system permease protein
MTGTDMTSSQVLNLSPAQTSRQMRSLWQDSLLHLLRDRLTFSALIVLIMLTALCFLGPPVVENVLGINVNRTNVGNRFLPPGSDGHILGTDHLGRDQLIRLLYGGRISLMIAYGSSVMIVLIGVTSGLIAGYYGGIIDDIISWFINTLSSIPPLFLLLVAAALWEPSAELLSVILALLGWVGTSRLVRGEVFSLRERDYVMAARALGVPVARVIGLHILPNLMSIIIVTGSIIAGNLILLESGLSFLGVGVQPPTPSWGNMLTDSRNYFVTGQHLVIWPGMLIMITVLCFYLVGDGLRDALDPYSARKR